MGKFICGLLLSLLCTSSVLAASPGALPAIDAAAPMPAPDTLFELEVVKVLLSDEHRDGVDWEAIMADYTPLYLDHNRWLGAGSLSLTDHGMLQEALETIGDVEIYRSPDVSLAHGEEAVVNLSLRGSQTMVAVSMPVDPTAAEKVPPKDGTDIDMSFSVVPYHNADQTFDVQIRTLSQNIKDKTVQLRIGPEDVIVIGGLFQEQQVAETHKVPILGDIPFFGAVFRSRTSDVLKNEVIVFLRPAKPVILNLPAL